MAYSFLLLAAPLIVLGLPGSFGRYLERYRQRQQLRIFLRRTAIWTAALTTAAVTIMGLWTPSFSWLVFGRPDRKTLVMLIAGSLVAVILHQFLEALFAALRKFRIVSTMHFCQSLGFAVISLSLLWWWRLSAESVVVGYGAACLVSAVGVLLWTGRSIADVAAPGPDVAHREFWPPLVRFAIWIWFTNLLCNLFAVVDRYMLVHWSGLDAEAALTRDRDALLEPRLGTRRAAARIRPAQSDPQAHVARDAGSERSNTLGRAAAVPRGVRGQVRRRTHGAAVDAHVLRLVCATDRGPELHLVCGENQDRFSALGDRAGRKHLAQLGAAADLGAVRGGARHDDLDRAGAGTAVWAESP
jgi:hypothetical protein